MSPFGSSSKSSSSDSCTGGIGPEAIVGEENLRNKDQGVRGVVRVGGQCFGAEELKIGHVL